jgi:hypothetical protein
MREMVFCRRQHTLLFATTLGVAGDSGSIEIAAHLPAPLESRTRTGKAGARQENKCLSLGACRHQVAGGHQAGHSVSPTTSSRTTTCWAAAGERDIVEKRKATKHCVKARPRIKIIAPLQWISVWGPGLLVMLADTDAGNVVTAAQAGAQWRYRLLPLLIVLMPMLYMVQELTVRLGIYTGRGHGELIRERFGVGWAWLSTAGLAAAAIGSLVTEFTGVAGIGELYGMPRSLTLPVASAALLIVVATAFYRRVERIAIVIGLFELAFFAVAWAAHPNLETLAKDAVDLPLYNREFRFLAAAVIGAVFNPWMIFYQQAAIADKKLRSDDLKAARWDTAVGAVLTQCLTGAVLIAAAATLASSGVSTNLGSIGEISNALTPLLGEGVGRLVFSVGVYSAPLWWPPSCARWRWPGGWVRSPVTGVPWNTGRSRPNGSMASMWPAHSVPPPLFGSRRIL